MKTTILSSLVIALALALSPATMAKAKKKANPRAVTGVYCSQGPGNVYISASRFKPSQRKLLRVGQKSKIKIAGVGPVDCVVY